MPLIRRIHLRGILLALSLLALIIAAVAFAYSLAQTQHLATQNKTITAAQRAEVRRHCIADAAHDNRQRRLDLALMAADQAVLAHLKALHPAGPVDRTLHQTLIAYYSAALAARLTDIPQYVNPARC